MDQLYRNVRTGEIKPLPPKVYQAVKKHWEPVEEEAVLGESPDIAIPHISRDEIIPREEIKEAVKENFKLTYEALTGQKPDGRWSEKKLAEKIKELKENQ